MSREKNAVSLKIVPIVPEEAPAAPPEQPFLPRSIFRYAFVLLGVSFLMVLLSFLSHVQKSSQQIANMQASQTQLSVSALQSLETLQRENADFQASLTRLDAENEALLARLAGLEAQRAEAEQALAAERESLARLREEAARAAALAETRQEALDSLWRLERLVSLRRYSAARVLMADMLERGLDACLPAETPAGAEPDTLSPAGEFARLAEALG